MEDAMKPVLASQTIRYILLALIAYVVKTFGLPALPAELHGEIVTAVVFLLDALIPWAMLMAARARVRATERLKVWWRADA